MKYEGNLFGSTFIIIDDEIDESPYSIITWEVVSWVWRWGYSSSREHIEETRLSFDGIGMFHSIIDIICM